GSILDGPERYRRKSDRRSLRSAARTRDRRDLSAGIGKTQSLFSRPFAETIRRHHSHRRNARGRTAGTDERVGQRRVARNLSVQSVMTEVRIPAGRAMLDGNLTITDQAKGLVLFVHGSGSSRHSQRNEFVARTLNQAGLGTLLFDLLTPEEESVDLYTRKHRFNIGLLAERLVCATTWAKEQKQTRDLRVGYFGSSTGGGAALVAAAELPNEVFSVVSRGGRPDLAGDALPKVKAPTLPIVGGEDHVVIEMNEEARAQMKCECKIDIVPGATHWFEEPGALEKVAKLASDWFVQHIGN